MAASNVELLREGYEAFARGGEEAILHYLDPEIELAPIDQVPDGQIYRGHDGFRQYIADTREIFGNFGWDALEFIEAGESVVVRTRFHAEGRESGVPVELTVFIVWTFRNGRIVRSKGYLDRAEAMETAGTGAEKARRPSATG